MALPIVNELPKYEVTIPSTGKKTRFRPYLVKEEKTLMMAFETGDQKTGMEAVIDTIVSCVDEPIDRNRLTTFDVEYLLLKIRSKSVGETINISVKCKECETPNSHSVVIDEINVSDPKNDKVIKLTEDISIEMKYPSLEIMTKVDPKELGKTENIFKILSQCIDAVLTKEERISTKDESEEEMMTFLESLTSDQFKKLSDFMNNVPKLSHTIEFKCEKCEKDNTIVVEGIQSFFS